MRKKGIGSHQRPNNGETVEWLTPPDLIEKLGAFDLDPCSPINRPWPTAAKHFTINDDGLSMPWSGRVWLNPPYGDQLGRWLQRLALHGRGTALIFARTETEAFRKFVWEAADAILFLYSRLHFHYPDGTRASFNGGAPSVLVAYGDDDVRILGESAVNGYFMLLPEC